MPKTKKLFYRSLNDIGFDDGWTLFYQTDFVSAGHPQSEGGCSDQRIAVFDNGFDCYYSWWSCLHGFVDVGYTSNVFSAEVCFAVGQLVQLYFVCFCCDGFALVDCCCCWNEVGCCWFGCRFDAALLNYNDFQI